MASKKIQIIIGAKDKTRAAFAKVTSAMNVLKKSVFNLKTGIAGLVGVGGFIALARAGLKSIDNIGKLSRTLGLTTEQLGTLQHMANLGGTSLDTFARSIRNLDKGALDFVTKGTGEAKDAFEALGISVKDVSDASEDQIKLMGLVADKLAPMENGAKKTALAMKLFGSRSVEILPSLEQGSKGINAMAAEAKQLGIILDKDAVHQVEEANDAMARMGSIFEGIRNKIVVGLSPAIITLATAFKDKLVDSMDLSGEGIVKFTREALISIMYFINNSIHALETWSNKVIKFLNNVRGLKGADLIPYENWWKAQTTIQGLISVMEEMPETIVPVNAGMKRLTSKIEGVGAATKTTKDSLKKFSIDAQDTVGQLKNATVRGLESMEDAMLSLGQGTTSLKDSFKSMAVSIVQDIQRMTMKKFVSGPIGDMLGGAIDSIFGSSSAAVPARAMGGPLRSGQTALVGERGPELFTPNAAGKVIANKDISGGGVTINNSFDFSGANPATIALLQDQAERIKKETFNNVFNSINKGGQYARIVGRRS
jgi:methyl-accepting chemotaxis protein